MIMGTFYMEKWGVFALSWVKDLIIKYADAKYICAVGAKMLIL
jgi:hypothetical protein